jgi:hypothetical protein
MKVLSIFLLVCCIAVRAQQSEPPTEAPEYYKLAVAGKYDDALKILQQSPKLSSDDKLLKALCLIATGNAKEAMALAKDMMQDEELSPWADIATKIERGELAARSEELKAAILGTGEIMLEIESETNFPDVIIKRNLDDKQPVFLRGEKNIFWQVLLAPGKYFVFVKPSHKLKDSEAYISDHSVDGIAAGEISVVAWKRAQKIKLRVPPVETFELTVIDGKRPVDPTKAAFQIRSPRTLKYSIDVVALPPNSISKDSNVRIWTQEQTGPAIIPFNSNEKAAENLKTGERYIVRANWIDPVTKEEVIGRVQQKFEVK